MIKQAEEIIRKAKRLQNGDVSRAMKRMGIIYELNYGVSIPQLRQLANQCTSNSELAIILLNTEVREAKIMASMLIDTQNISIDQLLDISTKVDNLELVEQFSQNCFSHCSELNLLLPILNSASYWQKILAHYAASWQIKKQKSPSIHVLEWSIEQINLNRTSDDGLLQKAVGFLIQSIASFNDEYKKQMFDLAENMLKSNKISEQSLAQEFLWLNIA